MSDLYYKLSELRPHMRSIAEYAAWPGFFLAARAVNQELLYFAALFIVLATDVIDIPRRGKAFLRDLAAGAMTLLIALSVNDRSGLVVGGLVALGATLGLLQSATLEVWSIF